MNDAYQNGRKMSPLPDSGQHNQGDQDTPGKRVVQLMPKVLFGNALATKDIEHGTALTAGVVLSAAQI
jgi:hypothetical protein